MFIINNQKRVLAAHDISCYGRCSLTVALPILSACGIETVILPTAVLSTHTGGFTGYTFNDLTDDIVPITEHWKTCNLSFDAVYSGFLGSARQLDIMQNYFTFCKESGALIAVDPVMGDNGSLYTLFDNEFVKGMRSLCGVADLITPNFTEACAMLGKPYTPPPYTEEYITDLLKELSLITGRYVVLTGAAVNKERLGAACYDKQTGKTSIITDTWVEGAYHGTGDVFSSALVGALVRGKSIEEATKVAVSFTLNAIQLTKAAGTPFRCGVDFEQCLGGLIEALK